MRNRGRRIEAAKVFFDLSKYLMTTVAIGGLVTENLSFPTVLIASSMAAGLFIIAIALTPQDKE